MIWLAVVVAVFVGVTVAASMWWGLLAAGIALTVSEVVERSARNKRRAAAGQPKASLRDLLPARRKSAD
jgi:hypothetical protein